MASLGGGGMRVARMERWTLALSLAALILLFAWAHPRLWAGEERLAPIATVEGASIENGGYLIDINTADARTLETLPGIGEVLAESIMAYREEHGPFASVDELDHVYGIGEGKLEPIRRFLTVEPSQAPKSCTQ